MKFISPDVKHPNTIEAQFSSDFSFYYNWKGQHGLSKNVAKVKQFHQFPLFSPRFYQLPLPTSATLMVKS